MGQRLSPDDLGQTGEDLFSRLCSQAGLICNKSHRDRAGWDFVVDMPATRVGSKSLDQRPAAACSVQLKSTSNPTPVRLVLSAIERLAKDPRPAFVIVLRLAPDGREVAGYLIHLLGPILERILRRLRQAEADRLDISKATISLNYQNLGRRFELTPDGLKAVIDEACRPQVNSYVLEKQRQLDGLGYDDGRLMAEATVWVESPEHLSRMLIGLEPMRPVQLRTFDVRFGVAIPFAGAAFDDVEELRIEPPRIGSCQVAVRGAPMTKAAVFAADAYVGPPMPDDEHVWLLVRHEDFTLTFAGGARFETVDGFSRRRRPLVDWVQLARALTHLAGGQGVVSFQFEGAVQSRLTLPMSEPLNGPETDRLPQLVQFIDGWSRLTETAGVLAVEPFSFEDLWGAKDVQMAVDMMTNPSPTARFEFEAEVFGRAPDSVSALYFNTCRFGGAALSYCVKVTLEPQGAGTYRSVAFIPLDARAAVDDLQAYGEELATAAGIRVLIHPDKVVEVSLEAMDERAP